MKQVWTVSRTLEPHSDGQRRWDIAYPLLWQWTLEREAQATPTVADNQRSRMNIALYLRVSTGRLQQKQTIEQQLARLQAQGQQHPDWQLSEEHIYRDDGYSGSSFFTGPVHLVAALVHK